MYGYTDQWDKIWKPESDPKTQDMIKVVVEVASEIGDVINSINMMLGWLSSHLKK